MSFRAVGDKNGISSTVLGVCAAYVLTIVLSISFSTPASALRTVPGSPCADTCTRNELNYANNTVCFDEDYQTGGGRQFRECTTCLLNSTAIDAAANISDVHWGLCKNCCEIGMDCADGTSQPSIHPRRMHVRISRRNRVDIESLSSDVPTASYRGVL